jgi:hypothetical protein
MKLLLITLWVIVIGLWILGWLFPELGTWLHTPIRERL